METDIHPITRVLLTAVMILLPLALVVNYRLPALKELLRKDQSKEKDAQTSINAADGRICSSCHRCNPPDHDFCGFCGKRLKNPYQGEPS